LRKQFTQKYLTKRKAAYIYAAFFLLLSIIVGIAVGTVSIPIFSVVKILVSYIGFDSILHHVDPMHINIVQNIRLPRVILAGLVGASLSIAGAAFQGLLRNPLADPYTLGVSSGASVGAVITLFFHLQIPFLGSFTLPFMSVLFSFLIILFVIFFSKRLDPSMRVETIILTGIVISSFLSACISLMIALTGNELRQIIGWLLGSVSMRGWSYIKMMLPFFVVGSLILLSQTKELNAFAFGEERAQHLGIHVQRRKMIILFAGSMLTGVAVAVSGTIGFIGLVIPHFVRILIGPDHKHLLVLSVLTGSGFTILADLFARTIISPTELPIGVITALIGAPVFANLLLRRRRS